MSSPTLEQSPHLKSGKPARKPTKLQQAVGLVPHPDDGSHQPGEGAGRLPDKDRLLELCNDVRVALYEQTSFGTRDAEISQFLGFLWQYECAGLANIAFETIHYSRLDKLLEDVIELGSAASPDAHSFASDLTIASSLQRRWSIRFRDRYFDMDLMRCSLLFQQRLFNIFFDTAAVLDQDMWKVKPGTSRVDILLKPGHWWLNLACALRDGIVRRKPEMSVKGRNGVLTLPLLTGREDTTDNDESKYICDGRLADMHTALMTLVGSQIRVLRGYQLKSVLAPQAGVRYDGLYTLSEYGVKRDRMTDVYRLSLVLRRARDQKPVALIMTIPQPSQLDDWLMYQKLECESVKRTRGHNEFLEWKIARAEERVERELWRSTYYLKASLTMDRNGVLPSGARLGPVTTKDRLSRSVS